MILSRKLKSNYKPKFINTYYTSNILRNFDYALYITSFIYKKITLYKFSKKFFSRIICRNSKNCNKLVLFIKSVTYLLKFEKLYFTNSVIFCLILNLSFAKTQSFSVKISQKLELSLYSAILKGRLELRLTYPNYRFFTLNKSLFFYNKLNGILSYSGFCFKLNSRKKGYFFFRKLITFNCLKSSFCYKLKCSYKFFKKNYKLIRVHKKKRKFLSRKFTYKNLKKTLKFLKLKNCKVFIVKKKNPRFFSNIKKFLAKTICKNISYRLTQLYRRKAKSRYCSSSQLTNGSLIKKTRGRYPSNIINNLKSSIRWGFFFTSKILTFVEFQSRRGDIRKRNLKIWLDNILRGQREGKRFTFLKQSAIHQKSYLYWDKRYRKVERRIKKMPQYVKRKYLNKGTGIALEKNFNFYYNIGTVLKHSKFLRKRFNVGLKNKKFNAIKRKFNKNRPGWYELHSYHDLKKSINMGSLPRRFSDIKEINFYSKSLSIIPGLLNSSSVQKSKLPSLSTRIPTFLCRQIYKLR